MSIGDPLRTGVDGVFDEFLYYGSGALDDFTGRNLTDGHCVEFAYARHVPGVRGSGLTKPRSRVSWLRIPR